MAIAATKWVRVSGGVQLATFERGQGKPIVLIAGLGASAHDWGPTADRLAARARVVTFDNRGAGQSTAADEPITLEQLADDAVAVFDAYGLRSAHLIGSSMGGMIAQLVALRRPELVERLVLLGTHPGIQSAIPATPEARAVLLAEENLPREQMVRKRYATYVAPSFLERHRDVFEQMMAVRLANLAPEYVWRRQMQAIMQSERAEQLRTLRMPTLIIHGRDDPLIRFGNGEKLRDLIPGAQLVAIDDCGHMANWEKPDVVVAAIVDFLQLP